MSKVLIIAEAGVNHNGDIEIAKKMIDAAAEAGADAVKFQTFKTEELVCKNARKAEYQLNTTNINESQFDMLKKLELSYDMHKELITHCLKRKIQFLSTPFDIASIYMLNKLEINTFKISSGDITNYPYLCEMGKLKKKIILSTGMSNMSEVKEAICVLRSFGADQISALHCSTEYPTPMQNVNLNAILSMKHELGIPIGYSDHTEGIEISLAAVSMGAEIIEKHFTLNRNMEGPDHKASLEPRELKTMITYIRNIELAMGNGKKAPSESEVKNISAVRKSIVASTDIKAGEFFSQENITVKRPGSGINPMHWNEIIGNKANRHYSKDELIEKK